MVASNNKKPPQHDSQRVLGSMECRSCGDNIPAFIEPSGPKALAIMMDPTQSAVTDKQREGYCAECAAELATGRLPDLGCGLQHGTGGGRRVIHSAKPLA